MSSGEILNIIKKRLLPISFVDIQRNKEGFLGIKMHEIIQTGIGQYTEAMFSANHINGLLNNLFNALDELTNISRSSGFFEGSEAWKKFELFVSSISRALEKKSELNAKKTDLDAEDMNYANLSLKLGEYHRRSSHENSLKLSIQCGERTLEILSQIYNEDHSDIATILHDLGQDYAFMENKTKGVEYLEKALEMHNRLYSCNRGHRNYAFSNAYHNIPPILRFLGNIYDDVGDKKKGIECLERVVKFQQELYKGDFYEITMDLYNLGMLYENLNNKKKKMECLEEALGMEKRLGHNQKIVAILYQLGLIYESLDDARKSKEFHKKAYFMSKKYFGKDHDKTKIYKKSLEAMYSVKEILTDYCFNEDRVIIKNSGDWDDTVFEIRCHTQSNVLNKIQKQAQRGRWMQNRILILSGTFRTNSGISRYLKPKYLKECLGCLYTEDNLKRVQMLCFEAINIGIMSRKEKNRKFICAEKFASTYPNLVKEILQKHPEYFVDGSILNKCKYIVELDPKLVEKLTKA